MAQVSVSFPDQTYTTSNKPSVETLKSDLNLIEAAVNASDAEISSAQTTAQNRANHTGTDLASSLDGWLTISDTLAYESATEFFIAGSDETDVYTKGLKLKLTNDGSTKYFYVVSSLYSSPNTTVTVTGEVNLANAAITSPYLSYADKPKGFNISVEDIGCKVYLSTAQSIPNAATTKVELDTIISDPNSNFDNTTNYNWTCPLAGRWLVFIQNSLAPAASGDIGSFVFVNGTTAHFMGAASATSVINQSLAASKELVLDKGDTVDSRVYQGSGSALNTSSEERAVGMSIIWVGP